MVAIELMILGVFDLITLSGLVVLAFWIRKELDSGLEELDERLAEAIRGTLDKLGEGGLAQFEPPNPIQIAIGRMLEAVATQKLNTIDATITERDQKGQFAKSILKTE